MRIAVRFKAWIIVNGHAIGELEVPLACLRGRASAEGAEVYVAIGAPDEPIPVATGSMRLGFDHGFPPPDPDDEA